MADYDSLYVAFTLEQLAEMGGWAAGPRSMFDLRIATDHVYLPEVAIFSSRPELPPVRYLLNPLRDGSLVLMRPAGGHWFVPTVRAALAKILHLEHIVSG